MEKNIENGCQYTIMQTKFFLWIYIRMIYLFMKVYYFFFKDTTVKPKTILEETTEFVDNKKTRFANQKQITINKNNSIDSVFYSKTEFQGTIAAAENRLEKSWKSRILFENTPRGNIVMYYDPFKFGFAYYSDSNGIPYNILNSVAMKYVSLYKCYDFFFDNEVTEDISLIYKIHFEEEPKKGLTEDGEKKAKTGLEDAPFAKLKNYNKVSSKTKPKESEKKSPSEQKPVTEYIRNKFICLGKMANFQILQKEKKTFKGNGFKSALLDGVSSESELQNTVLDYKEYKKRLIASMSVANPSTSDTQPTSSVETTSPDEMPQ
jgi:hypothetical protein